MTPHTPGPWHVSKAFVCREIRADDGPFIASVYDHTMTYGERNANARLIAAAPALLAALQTLHDDVIRHGCTEGDGDAWLAAFQRLMTSMEAAGAAIAKAEGR